MLNIFEKLALPPTYKKNGKDCFLDPLRKKLIYVTPEEVVRQKVVRYLVEVLHVPEQLITVEDKLSHYGIDSKRRADIIISQYDEESNERFPLTIVECKAPDVQIGESAVNQALDYAEALNAKYVMITNGNQMVNFFWPLDGTVQEIETLPVYEEMVDGEYKPLPPMEPLVRIPYAELLEKGKEYYLDEIIGIKTPESMIPCITNLAECLIDQTHRFPVGDYGLFRVLEDYGVRFLTYGTAGGTFSSVYRRLIIRVGDVTEFVSFGFNTYSAGKTMLAVALDDPDMVPHHALQFVFDNSLATIGKRCIFTHSGRISVGHIGSGKVDDLKALIADRLPELLRGNRIYLGELVNDRLWYMDDPEVVELFRKLIGYALVRDEYRKVVKGVHL